MALDPRDMPHTMPLNCRSPIDLRQLYLRSRQNLMLDTVTFVALISD